MKTAKNVDGISKMKLPSMKIAKNVDRKFKNQIPSMKTAYHVRPAEGVAIEIMSVGERGQHAIHVQHGSVTEYKNSTSVTDAKGGIIMHVNFCCSGSQMSIVCTCQDVCYFICGHVQKIGNGFHVHSF